MKRTTALFFLSLFVLPVASMRAETDSLHPAVWAMWRPSTVGSSLANPNGITDPLSALELPHLNSTATVPVLGVAAGVIPGNDTFSLAGGISIPSRRVVWTGALSYVSDQLGFSSRNVISLARPLGARLHGGASASLFLVRDSNSLQGGAGIDAALSYRLGSTQLHGGMLNMGYAPRRDEKTSLFPPFTPFAGVSNRIIENDQVAVELTGAVRLPSFQGIDIEVGGALVFPGGLSVRTGFREVIGDDSGSVWPGFSVAFHLPSGGGAGVAVQPLRGGEGVYSGHVTVAVPNNDISPPAVRAYLLSEDTQPPRSPSKIVMSPFGYVPQLAVGFEASDDRQIGPVRAVLLRMDGMEVRQWEFLPPSGNIPAGSLTERLSSDLWTRSYSGQLLLDLYERIDVADGEYQLVIDAQDSAGNTARSARLDIEIDSVPPTLTGTFQPVTEGVVPSGPVTTIAANGPDSQTDDQELMEVRPDEDLHVSLSWQGAQRISVVVLDEAGREVMPLPVVPARDGETQPSRLEVLWPGVGPNRLRVPEGVYVIFAEATDAAGNRSELRSPPVLVRTVRPVFSLALTDDLVAPNSDGNRDYVDVYPRISPLAGLEEWYIRLLNERGEEVYRFGGIDLPPERIRLDHSFLFEDGNYRLDGRSLYRNGAVATDRTALFRVDTVAPRVNLGIEQSRIQPEISRQLRLYPETDGTAVETDLMLYTSPDAEPVRVRRWQEPPGVFDWDLLDADGELLGPGRYFMSLEGRDLAGNRGRSPQREFVLLERLAGAAIFPERPVFGPTGNGRYDTIRLIIDSSALVGATGAFTVDVATYPDSMAVRRFSGTLPLPQSLRWDGRDDAGLPVPDGTYRAILEVDGGARGIISDRSGSFVVDTVAPSVALSVSPPVVSPDGDGRQDELLIEGMIQGAADARFVLLRDGREVPARLPAPEAGRIVWTPRGDDGTVLADGQYELFLEAEDDAGNIGRSSRSSFVVDTRPVSGFVRVSRGAFSPESAVAPTVVFTPVLPVVEGLLEWSLVLQSVEDDSAAHTMELAAGSGSDQPTGVSWDGNDSAGDPLPDGRYEAVLRGRYSHGPVVESVSPAVLLDSQAPIVTVDLHPELFSPDGDGTDDLLEFRISAIDESPIAYWVLEIFEPNGEFFVDYGGAGAPPELLRWDGRASNGELVVSAERYPWRLEIADTLGNTAVTDGVVQIDVLVERLGDGYRIQVPSITFPADSSRLVMDDEDESGRRNREVIERVATILRRFPEYSIVIEGHAVNLSGTEREETEELRPLSHQRALAVRQVLVENGIPARLLTAEGRGGTAPIVDHRDELNRWRNRRVDFILRR